MLLFWNHSRLINLNPERAGGRINSQHFKGKLYTCKASHFWTKIVLVFLSDSLHGILKGLCYRKKVVRKTYCRIEEKILRLVTWLFFWFLALFWRKKRDFRKLLSPLYGIGCNALKNQERKKKYVLKVYLKIYYLWKRETLHVSVLVNTFLV